MACENPRRAYPAADGGQVKFFKRTDSQYYMEPYTGLQLPCGTCILCRMDQARQTAVRITHEATLHAQTCFITLTYDEEHIPTHNVLDYSHLVNFWKLLRYYYKPISYYAVGEYGEASQRPHYHACLFGHDFYEGSVEIKPAPQRLWMSPKLNEIWGRGHVVIGALTHESASYVAGYILKKQKAKQRYFRLELATGEMITAPAPRSFMSRNIAKRWWEKWHQGVEDWDRVIIDARPQKPPRAYDRWLEETNKPRLEQIKNERQKKIQQKTTEQMRAHARNARAHAGTKKKSV